MGKAAVKKGLKSGILPATRSILKNPTIRQQSVIDQVKAVKPKGAEGIGYAPNVVQPRGSHRHSPRVEFLDVEKLISKTIAEPQIVKAAATQQQEAKQRRSELRRQYLADAFRKEEERLLKQEILLKKKQELLEQERHKELAALNETRSSDLTIPTLENILNEPLMRQRSPEETEVLNLKRKHNREVIQLRAKERKLEDLLKLYYIADEFIVTEKQLLKKIDEAFANESSEALRTKLSVGASRQKTRNEKDIGDALFGSLGGGNHIGLPVVKEFLSGEMREFAEEVEAKNKQIMEEKRNNMETIL